MNRNILTFLNEYAEIPDPQYAIMLRGAWGCGKTFFIRQWMEQLKSNRDADKVSKSILGLSNESRNTFLHFLQSRYKYTSYGTEIEYLNECCQSDLPQLKLINERLKTEAATRRLIEKYSIEKITNLIDEITAKVK